MYLYRCFLVKGKRIAREMILPQSLNFGNQSCLSTLDHLKLYAFRSQGFKPTSRFHQSM